MDFVCHQTQKNLYIFYLNPQAPNVSIQVETISVTVGPVQMDED